MANIKEQIDLSYNPNSNLINKWNNIRIILKQKYVIATKEISTSDSRKYLHDLEGLFSDIFYTKPEFIYPHIIVNGYNSSCDYNGEILRFKILDNTALNNYYRLFTE